MSSKEAWRVVYMLLLGQLASLFLAGSSFTSSLIAELGVDIPLTQAFVAYLFLALVYGAVFLYRRQKLLVPWYWYFVLAIMDVQGNYLAVKAYQYSSITSVTLLTSWTIPWVIILTWIALGTRYSRLQFFGAAVCVVGLGLALLSDSWMPGGGGKKPLLGNVLVVAGTFFFAFSNVGEEFCVKKKDQVEVVVMLSIFGMLVSSCQISLFERIDLESVKWSPTMICIVAGFATSSFLFYSTIPFVLKMSGSTLFSLSLLTSDMWAVIIRIFFYHQQVDWLYYVAFGIVALGLIIYSLNSTSHVTKMSIEDEEGNRQCEPLLEENNSSSSN